ncbi:MAG: 4'-phosphopantetheinyl transferase superfamily protein [Butyrivibrio sp.]|uniref:4'-phosphopantetheinyl transferase family protein n=1 Tax=Butyrivibrio sp. TaxID=28121 RepID=UPI001B0D01D7|nr:4'-phosphopantetheinyl transferase superfamily protein [Butyrivibrio sp.]MBO6241827.1 4'-phosphopantetheinyl transferase superfamily protein [Butyrivibrio sp.]
MNKIYIVDINSIRDRDVYEYWYEQMSIERKKKIDKYKPDQSKLLSLAAGIALKRAFEEAEIKSFEIYENDYGKPYIKGEKDIFFNLSHSGDKAIIAISDMEVGIDIQEITHFEKGLIKRVFTEGEIEQVSAAEGEKDAIYTALWTAKESIMKYYGKGLSMDPLKIEIRVKTSTDFETDGELKLFRKEMEGYQITICSSGADFSNISITDVFNEKG